MNKIKLTLFITLLSVVKLFSQANGNFQWILNQDGAITNDVLRWDGSAWKPVPLSTLGVITNASGTARQVAFFTNATTISGDTSYVFDSSKRLSIGRSFSQPASRLTLFGTGTTLTTFAFTHYSSDGVKKTDLTDSGVLRLFNSSGANALQLSSGFVVGATSLEIQANSAGASGINITNASGGITLTNGASIASVPVVTFDGGSKTSTTQNVITGRIITGFAPTASGTNTFTGVEVAPTINQTGEHTGISYGVRLNPTLTSAADWRSIQIDNASGYGIYQSNSGADNFFNGQVGIGATPNGSNILTVSGGMRLNLGSDATGDLFYRNSSGNIARLGVGINGQVLTLNSGLPSWQNPGSGADNWGSQVVVRDSSLIGWGVTANPLGIRGYSAASNGQVPSKATGGITWITPGTVTNFSSGNLSLLFTTSVATATTTPALSFTLSNASANTWFGNNTGSSAAPSYNTAGSVTKSDDTNVTLTLGGSPTNSVLNSFSMTLGWTGTLAATRGGTGTGTTATGDLLVGAAGNTWNKLNIGANNTFLKSNGTTASWSTIASTDLSNSSNIALLNANQTFTGTNTYSLAVTTTNEIGTYTTITTNASTLNGTNSYVYLNVASAGSTVTLPADGNVSDGEWLFIFNVNSNAIDILANGANQNINGGSQITDVPQNGHVVLQARITGGTTINWQRWE